MDPPGNVVVHDGWQLVKQPLLKKWKLLLLKMMKLFKTKSLKFLLSVQTQLYKLWLQHLQLCKLPSLHKQSTNPHIVFQLDKLAGLAIVTMFVMYSAQTRTTNHNQLYKLHLPFPESFPSKTKA